MTVVVTFETKVPQDIYLTLQAKGLFRENLETELCYLLAVHLYHKRILSLGKAARLAQLGRWHFIDLLGQYNVPIIDYGEDELETEFIAVESLMKDFEK
jgi:predicted HTH domain antitoxin